MKTRFALLVSLLVVASMLLTACPAPTPQTVVQTVVVEKEKQVVQTVEVEKKVIETQVVEKIVEATKAPEAKPIVTWFQYDQGNVDPKSDERVGNEYLRKTIPEFDKAFEGKWVWNNEFTPWDRAAAKIVAAVQNGAEVPDLIDLQGYQVNNYYKNGTMQDLTEWAKAQSWYSKMDGSALQMCTGPDGKLYCIPMSIRPSAVYVWKDRFPNGFPKTPEEMLKEGERLKAEGKYAMTFFGSTAFDGEGAIRAIWQVINSFGGSYDDGNGKLKLNTPENIAAITWLREMVQKGYVPEIAFAGGFQEEEAFKDSSAGAFPTLMLGYRYINPLTAPSGKKYEKANADDMFDAIGAGDIYLAPMVAPEGNKHGCGADISALGIPVGAKNGEGAHDFINWVLAPEQNPGWVLGPGAGFPADKETQASEQFQTPFYKQAAEVVAASNCKMPFPTIADTKGAGAAVMNAVYKLIKTDPAAEIAAELQKAEDEFNKLQ
jgi:ABC-type glycerol-3-phosphate transport system substrate-binding protein